MSDLLPPNATAGERAISSAVARVGDVPAPVRSVWDADTCPTPLLPWLAWAFSVDQWDASWSDAQKRATIKSAAAVQRYKGTIASVRESIAALGTDAAIQEWFNQSPAGAPYTFNLVLNADQVGATQAQLQKLVDVVNSAKNLRSHLGSIVPSITSEATLTVGGASFLGSEISVSFAGNLVSNGVAISNGHYKSNSLKLD